MGANMVTMGKFFWVPTWFEEFWSKMLANANIVCSDHVIWEKFFGCQHDLRNLGANVDTVNIVNTYRLNGNFEKSWQFPPPPSIEIESLEI